MTRHARDLALVPLRIGLDMAREGRMSDDALRALCVSTPAILAPEDLLALARPATQPHARQEAKR